MKLAYRSKGTLALCATLALLAPSCGDDDDSDTTVGGRSGGSGGKGGATAGAKSFGGTAGAAKGGTSGASGKAGLGGSVPEAGAGGVGGDPGDAAGAGGVPTTGSGGQGKGGKGGSGGLGTGGKATGGVSTGGTGTGGLVGTAGEGGVGGVGGEGGWDEGGAGGAGGDSGSPVCNSVTPTTGQLLFSFDTPGSAGGWVATYDSASTGGLGDSFIARDASQGHACAGSLVLTVPFSTYGTRENAYAQVNYGPTDWTGRTRLHVWVRIPNPGGNLAYLNAIRVQVLSQSYAITSSVWTPAAQFSDFGWHEIILDLTAAPAVVLTAVNQLGVQALAHDAAPAGGPAAPMTTEIHIDDIWLE